MKPAIKYGIIAIAWIVYLLIGITGSSGSNNNTSPSNNIESADVVNDSDKEKSVITETENEPEKIISTFAEKFNKNSEIPLEYTEDFMPSDKNSDHYRTEFRLNAYSDAKGKSYTYGEGDAIVDLVARKSWSGDVLRIYMDGASFEQ